MSHELSDEDLAAYFREDIQPDLNALIQEQNATQGQATVVFVGAQPAAGKTRANAQAMQEDPRLIPVIGDDLRLYHPDYDALMTHDPVAMPDATARASGRWIGMSNDYLRSQGASTLVETTLRQEHVLLAELEAFKDAGYATDLRVLAVPPEVSRASTLIRYAADASQHDAGRWTPSASHDAAGAAGPATVQAAITSGLLDRVSIQDRQGHVLYSADITADTRSEVAQGAVQALQTGRDVTNLSARDADDWLENTAKAVSQCVAAGERDPDVISTIRRIAQQDAPAIAHAAHPGNPGQGAATLSELGGQVAILEMQQLRAMRGPAVGAPARRGSGERSTAQPEHLRRTGQDEGLDR